MQGAVVLLEGAQVGPSAWRGGPVPSCLLGGLDDVPGPGSGAFHTPWGQPQRGTVSVTGYLLGTGPQGLTHRRAVQPAIF